MPFLTEIVPKVGKSSLTALRSLTFHEWRPGTKTLVSLKTGEMMELSFLIRSARIFHPALCGSRPTALDPENATLNTA